MAGESERWKRKYFDELKISEQLEKRLENHTEQLRQAVTRLSIIAEGRDADLDDRLSQIREFLRQGQVSGLSKLVDRLEGGFEKWQSQKESFKQNLIESLVTLETSYESLPKSCLSPLKKLRKQVRQSESDTLLLAAVSVLGSWAEAMTGQSVGESSGSWFSRLFSKNEAQTPAHPAQDSQQESDQHAQFEIQDINEQALGKLESLTLDVSAVLSGLITKLTLPNDEQPKALRLLSKTRDGLDWYELVPALEVLAELVVSALDSEQEDFETFLKNLNERLQTLQDALQQSETLKREFETASSEFDAKMRGHLDDLKNTLANSSDIQDYGTLKQAVSTQLDDVFSILEGFRFQQKGREQAFQDQISQLHSRIHTMESELESAKNELQKSRLKALTDSLTQLPNRGAYDIYIKREVERFNRFKSPLCLLVCDVDKFKSINDTYGHQAGDKVLQIIARQVKKGTRESDLVARYGGEEFVAILPETNIDGAMEVAEKIRQHIEKSPFHFKGKRVQITISCGVAEFKENCTAEQVFNAADAALYQAKEGGRNQCRVGKME